MLRTVRTSLALVSAVALVSVVVSACADDEEGSSSPSISSSSSAAPAAADFCSVFVDHRDGAPEEATEYADQLETVGAPDGVGQSERAGFAAYLAYLRDVGRGRGADSYEDQYRMLLDGPVRPRFVAFLDAADEQCGTSTVDTAPTDATDADYCAAFEGVFGSRPSDQLKETGTPDGLGAASYLSVESRHGFAVMADVMADLTPAQADVLEAGDDDAMVRIVGVTDAYYADTWFVMSYARCFGED